MNVFKNDIFWEEERWIEGKAEGQISDIQYGGASVGSHTFMYKSISGDLSCTISPPPE